MKRGLWLGLSAALLAPLLILASGGLRSAAQTPLSVPWDTGTFLWTPGVGGTTPEAFRVECGSASGLYDIWHHETPYPDVDLPVSWVVPSPGTYFCAVVAMGTENGVAVESPPSNEVWFTATAPPPPPPPPSDVTPPAIVLGGISGTGSKRRIAVHISDDVIVARVEVYVNGSLKVLDETDRTPVDLSVPIPMAKSVTVEVRAWDPTGNRGVAVTTVNR